RQPSRISEILELGWKGRGLRPFRFLKGKNLCIAHIGKDSPIRRVSPNFQRMIDHSLRMTGHPSKLKPSESRIPPVMMAKTAPNSVSLAVETNGKHPASSGSPAAMLEAKLRSKTAKIGVVGLGYVGLPLAIEFTKKGFLAV